MPADVDFVVLDARINLKQWNKAIAQMEADAQGISKELEKRTPSVTADVDFKVDDQKLKRVDSDLQSLKQGVTVDVDATNTDALAKLEEVTDQLDKLKKLTKLQLILQAPDIIENIGGFVGELPIVSNLIEMDTALGTLEATTGRLIPGAETLIKDLYTNAWGESVTEISKVIGTAQQLGVTQQNLQSAVEQAFIIEALGIADADEALRRMDTMVKNGLVPTFEDAANIIVTGFQTGANKGDDLLDTFNEYGSTFKTLGLTAQDALAFINSGLAVGVDNSDRIADALRETGIRLAEMGTNESIANAFEQLDELSDIDLTGMFADFQAGDIDGGQFYTAFFQALEDAAQQDQTKAKELAATLVGTIAEDFGIEAITQLSGEWEPVWGAIDDRAQQAAKSVNDNLGTAITELTRTIETDLVDSLNTALDLDGLVDKAKLAIQRLAAALREGKGFGEALEIALEMPGLAERINQLESALANFIIDFLSAIATVGEALGADVTGIRETVARFSVGQLEFDLQNVPPEQMRDAIERAMARGVDGAELHNAIGNAIGAELERGDIGAAQAIADSLKASMDVSLVRPLIEVAGGVDEAIAKVQQQLDLANVAKISPLTGGAANAQIELLENQMRSLQLIAGEDELFNPEVYDLQIMDFVAGLRTQLAEAMAAGDIEQAAGFSGQLLGMDLGQALDEQMVGAEGGNIFTNIAQHMQGLSGEIKDFSDQTTFDTEEVTDAMKDLGEQTVTTSEVGSAGVETLYSTITSDKGVLGQERLRSMAKRFDAVADSIKGALEQISKAEDQVGSGAIEGAAVGGLRGPGAIMTGETGRELVFTDERVGILNNQTTERLFAAMSQVMGSGGSTTMNNQRTVNYSPIINVQNQAQAALFGGHALDQLRGLGF